MEGILEIFAGEGMKWVIWQPYRKQAEGGSVGVARIWKELGGGLVWDDISADGEKSEAVKGTADGNF